MLRQGMILEEISVASLSAGGGAFFCLVPDLLVLL